MATPTALPAAFTVGEVLTSADMNLLRGAFRVLQVVSATYSTETSNSTSTPADTGLTATITPQSNTSKILCLVNQAGCTKSAGNLNNAISVTLNRGVTNINNFCVYGARTQTAIENVIGTQSTAFLDSPATTSATTYKTQFFNVGVGLASVSVQFQSSVSTITLLEISA